MLLAVKATHTMPTNRATYLRNSRPLTFRGARGAFEAGVSVARDFVDTLCNIGKHAVRANPSQSCIPDASASGDAVSRHDPGSPANKPTTTVRSSGRRWRFHTWTDRMP